MKKLLLLFILIFTYTAEAKVAKKVVKLKKTNENSIDFSTDYMRRKYATPNIKINEVSLSTIDTTTQSNIKSLQTSISKVCKAKLENSIYNWSRFIDNTKTENWQVKITQANKDLEECKNNPDLLFHRGASYFFTQQYSKMLLDFNNATNIKLEIMDYIVAKNDIVTIYVKDILEYFKQFPSSNLDPYVILQTIAVSKNNIAPTYTLTSNECKVLNNRSEYEEQVINMTEIIKADPTSGKYLFCRGFSYLMLGKYDEAKLDITKAREVDPVYANKDVDGMYLDAMRDHYNEKLINGDTELGMEANNYGENELNILKNYLSNEGKVKDEAIDGFPEDENINSKKQITFINQIKDKTADDLSKEKITPEQEIEINESLDEKNRTLTN